MKVFVCLAYFCALGATAGRGQTTPAAWPTADGTYTIRSFQFKDGETIDALRLHYLTLGRAHRDAAGHVDNAVLLLHGTGGDAHSLLNPLFSNVLFVPGGVLDITKYFVILPGDIGHGQSSKPSDGLHMRFPQYDYDDMVRSQHLMLTDGLHVDHLRLILGTSMGCMQSFVWGGDVSRVCAGAGAVCVLAGRVGWPQQNDAIYGDPSDQTGPGVDEWGV